MARHNVVITSSSPAEEVGPSWWPMESTGMNGIQYYIQQMISWMDVL